MKDLTVRTLSGLVLVALVFGCTLWSQWSFGALMLVVTVGGTLEFYKLCRSCGTAPLRGIGVAMAVAMFALNFVVFKQFGHTAQPSAGAAVLGLLLYIVVMVPTTFACELWHKHPTPLTNVATTLAGVLYVALPVSLLLYIPILLTGEWQPWTMLCYIIIVWANDVCAYLVGVCIGRHHMCERISPKKSWEGFFGGVAGAVLMGALCGWLLDGNIAVWCILALIIASTGVAGDFVESLFKRSAGVKDSGAIMPGHGGFLDRFDALLLSAPYAFVFLLILKTL